MSQLATRPEEERARREPSVGTSGRVRTRKFLRGRPDDPAWVRPSLIGLLVVTGVLYIWGLGASGWSNGFYAAAVQAGTKSWKAFFFGSFDASNFITVDKSAGALWVMDISARIFGVNSWSILVPEALEGVGTVGLVYLTVRRWFSPAAALGAALVAATTPVAVLMFRFDNPDALMVLLLTLAAYATVRAVEDGRSRWTVLAGSAAGFAFLAKMLQAFLVVPGLALVVLIAAPGSFWQRVRQLLVGGLAIAVSAGWWIVAVQLTPAADRPYIGGSQNNSLWNLIFGYNGFGRLTGNETGSVGGGPAGTAGRWGPTGLTRLFGAEMGTQISWLLPAALILLVAGMIVTIKTPRTNRTRAGLLLWGSWLLVTGLALSLGKGIIHQYYTVALAPAIAGVIGVGGALMWANRDRFVARVALAVSVAATAMWADTLLSRTPNWMPGMGPLLAATGLIAGAGILVLPYMHRGLRPATASLAVVAALAAPVGYTLDTVRTPHTGAIPTAGPAGASTGFGPGGVAPGAARLGQGRLGQGRLGPGALTPGQLNPGQFPPGQFPPGQLPPGRFAPGQFASPGAVGNGASGAPAGGPGGPGGPGGALGGPAGGLLNASKPSAAMITLLDSGASRYSWVAATVGANEAAGYQLATGHPVMALGGFNGTDPYPSLARFEQLVRSGRVHYFISGGEGPGGFGGALAGTAGTSTSSAISQWVRSHFSSQSVGATTVYDLSKARTG